MKTLDTYFSISQRGSRLSTEIIAGIVTFASMVYILAVQPNIMSAAGMDPSAVFTATAISAGFATILMGIYGRIPIALASGLGINAFIAFTICGTMGFPWQVALAVVFVEGLIFLIISLLKIREKIVDAIPETVKKAVGLGIGLFIAVVGLESAGMLSVGGGTPIALHSITSGTPLVAVMGLIILIVLYALKVPGSIFIAILATTIIGIPFHVTAIPEGFKFFSFASAPYTPFDIIAGLEAVNPIQFLTVMIALLFVDIFDTVATLISVAHQSNLMTKDGKIVNVREAMITDAIGTMFGSLVGAITVTAYIESSTGVAVGGKTGIASVVTGLLFFVSLIFAPLFLLVPGAATAPALIFVGFLMLGTISQIDLKNIEIGLPIFITMLILPFSYSIGTGLAWGFISYVLVKCAMRKFKEINLTTWILTIIFLIKIITDTH